jgi:SAM-dependent methyltransferase
VVRRRHPLSNRAFQPDQGELRSRQAREVFDRTETYLSHDAPIDVRAAAVREMLGELEGKRILDVGCGDGRISLQYLSSSNTVTLLDVSPRMLEAAAARIPPALVSRAECVNVPLQDYRAATPFDVVLCIGVLAHVSSLPQAIQRAAELTAPGGACVLQLTDHDRLLGKVHDAVSVLRRALRRPRGYAVNRIRLGEVLALAADHGLVAADSRRYWGLWPGMGLLPRELGLRFMELTRRRAFLSRRGAEVLTLLRKS